ncbi:hypothetical protein HK096_005621 [Nowakowskiella sp. JEL0078]|nr:hypothetical protein HK096_005621 [Nowakowskiella sp. JEL0078]
MDFAKPPEHVIVSNGPLVSPQQSSTLLAKPNQSIPVHQNSSEESAYRYLDILEGALQRRERIESFSYFRNILLDNNARNLLNSSHFETLLELISEDSLHSDRLKNIRDVIDYATDLAIPKTRKMFNTLLDVVSDDCDLKLAKRIMKEMLNSNAAPDLHTYKSFLKIFVRNESPKTAWAFYKNMISEGIEPDLQIFEEMLEGFALANNEDMILSCLEEMQTKSILISEKMYLNLLDFYATSGSIERMEQIFHDLQKNGFSISTSVYMKILKGFNKAGIDEKFDEVFSILKQSEVDENVIKAYSSAITRLTSNNKLEEAIVLVNEMRSRSIELDWVIYSDIIESLCNKGNPDEAEEVFMDYCRTETPRQSGYFVLIEAYLKIGRDPDAIRLFWTMREKISVIRPKIYDLILASLAKNFDVAEFQVYWDDFLKNKYGPIEDSYNIALNAFISFHDFNNSMDTLERMSAAGYIPTMETYSKLIELCVHGGNFESAAKVLQKIKNHRIEKTVKSANREKNLQLDIDFPSKSFKNLFIENSKKFQEMILYLLRDPTRIKKSVRNMDDLAIELYHSLMRYGVIPETQVFREIMQVHKNRGDFRSVVKVFSALQQIEKDGLIIKQLKSVHVTKVDSTVLEILLESAKLHAGPKACHALLNLIKSENLMSALTETSFESILGMLARHGLSNEIIHMIRNKMKKIPMTKSLWLGLKRLLDSSGNTTGRDHVLQFMSEHYPSLVDAQEVEVDQEPLLAVIKKWVAEK